MAPPTEAWVAGKLADIERTMAAHELADTRRFAALDRVLVGVDGEEGPPLCVRMDVLERALKAVSRLLWAVLIAAVALMVERIGAHMDGPRTSGEHPSTTVPK